MHFRTVSARLAAAALLSLAPLHAQWGDTLERLHTGARTDQGFGEAIASVFDIDRDGLSDYVVGIPSTRAGTLTIGTVIAYSARDGRALFRIFGPRDNSRFGAAVTRAGDVDGDGTPDLLVGAPGDATGGFQAGSVTCLSGRNGGILWRRFGTTRSLFGASLAYVFPVGGGSSAGTFLVGAPGDGTVDSGFRLCDCRDGRILDSRTAPANHRLGTSVSVAIASPFGAVGAPGSGPRGEGSVRFVTISNGRLRDQSTYLSFDAGARIGTAITSWPAADGSRNWALGGPGNASIPGRVDVVRAIGSSAQRVVSLISPIRGDSFGQSLSGGGDLDRDQWADLLVGAPTDPTHGTNSGSYALISGRTLQLMRRVTLANGNRAGASVQFLVDHDGDRFPEFAVGIPSRFGTTFSGEVRILSVVHGGSGESYGSSCTSAELRVQGSGIVPGGTAGLLVRQLPQAGAMGTWVLGFDRASQSLDSLGMTGCFVHTTPVIDTPLATATSRAELDVPLPPDPSLVFAEFSAQAFVLEPGANALGLSSTAGLRVRIGNR